MNLSSIGNSSRFLSFVTRTNLAIPMKRFLISQLAATACLTASVAAQSFCVPHNPPNSGVRTWFHNPGLPTPCGPGGGAFLQDLDMDFPEFREAMVQWPRPFFGPMVLADVFAGCTIDHPHGQVVRTYLRDSLGSGAITEVESSGYPSWSAMLSDLASNFGEGAVVNLSNGPGPGNWDELDTQAVLAAYDAEVLLVGAAPTFPNGIPAIGSKVLRTWPMTASGSQWVDFSLVPINLVGLSTATQWESNGQRVVPLPGLGYGCSPAYTEHGSFTAPLVAGTVKRIANVVGARDSSEDYSIDRVLDYLISGCDRNFDPSTYAHQLNASLTSFGPWSPLHGYGVFSPWKALLYAEGLGRVQPLDSQLDSGVTDPETVFSDHFEMRGDLWVPAGHRLRVSRTGSLEVLTTPATGPTEWGFFPDIAELRVTGELIIESDSAHAVPGSQGVSATTIVDAGGQVTVANNGLLTIASGQVLQVSAGGSLSLEAGGEIVVKTGGQLKVIGGTWTHRGRLTVESGGAVSINSNAQLSLESDLVLPAGATLYVGSGVLMEVASSDLGQSGENTSLVEIHCSGPTTFGGAPNAPIVVRGQSSGVGTWSGLTLSGQGSMAATIVYTDVSDAAIGVRVKGSGPATTFEVGIHECAVGLSVLNRDDFTFLAGEIADCNVGVDLLNSNTALDGVDLHNNDLAVRCSASSPLIRRCSIWGNTTGIATQDSSSLPNLGTAMDSGDNSFSKPFNGFHLAAFQPSTDICAQGNWWGTTKSTAIAARIFVVNSPQYPTSDVLFHPLLTQAP